MTSTLKFIASLGIIAFVCFGVFAQSSDGEMIHFAEGGLSFDYPSGWSISDEGTPQVQQLRLTRTGSSVQIMIVAKRGVTLSSELPSAMNNLTEPLLKMIALKVGSDERPPQRSDVNLQVGPMKAEGVRLNSLANKDSWTGEVVWLRIRFRLISLAFIRSDSDEPVGARLWETIRMSLKVEAPVLTVMSQPTGSTRIEGGVLNGKAKKLPPPDYPLVARSAHASGTVKVQVVIDEKGNVGAAHAVSGHPLLLATCVEAARRAKFSPTLLEGEPVKVTGVITYNFVAQ